MKWFKHHSDFCNQESVSLYLDKCGKASCEGYGFLMRLIELISKDLKPSDNTAKKWFKLNQLSRLLRMHHNKVLKYFDLLSSCGVARIEHNQSRWGVTFDKLLKYKDTHTKNLEVVNKHVITLKLHVNTLDFGSDKDINYDAKYYSNKNRITELRSHLELVAM